MQDTLGVLHVPFTYFPDAVGGTEIYVAGLAAALDAYGFASAVAAPGAVNAEYRHHDVPVYRFALAAQATLGHAYGVPDENAARSFAALLARLQPRVVHLHARTAAISERLVDVAHATGAKVVFTYHTPAASCARGTMMYMGATPCDGRLDVRRCTACNLARHGVPPLLRDALACAPQAFGIALGRMGFAGGPFTALRMPDLVGAGHRRFRALMQKVDRVVAVCGWVADVLSTNGVPRSKLLLSRQGLTRHAAIQPVQMSDGPHRPNDGVLRLGFFGRLDPTKGVDILTEALRRVPMASVRLDIFGVQQFGSEDYTAKLAQAAADDPRIALRPALDPDSVMQAMRACDLVAVPSRWLETGPLVVLEAFAAGTPVLGTRLGGISELVQDEVDGLLVEPDDSAAWVNAIVSLAASPERLERLRQGVRPPRTMDNVASDMAALYRTVLGDGTC